MSGRHESSGWDADSFERWLTTQPENGPCIHEGEECPGSQRCMCGCDDCWYEDEWEEEK